MLKITILDSASELRFRLEGRLCSAWVGELQQCWQTAASTTAGRGTVLDLAEVDYLDPAGQALVAEMRREGVRVVANSPLIQSLIEEIPHIAGYGTVEERPARRPDAFPCPATPGRHSRTL